MNRVNKYRTSSTKKADIKKNWILVDASEQILGRMSSKVASMIRGKNKSYFSPNMDCGDNVVIINANKVKLTGNKWNNKKYIRYSGYPGGQKSQTAKELFDKDSTKMVLLSVKRMLPKNKLGRALLKNLYVYKDENHNQQAQKPKLLDLNSI